MGDSAGVQPVLQTPAGGSALFLEVFLAMWQYKDQIPQRL